jgi:hypothetical protein
MASGNDRWPPSRPAMSITSTSHSTLFCFYCRVLALCNTVASFPDRKRIGWCESGIKFDWSERFAAWPYVSLLGTKTFAIFSTPTKNSFFLTFNPSLQVKIMATCCTDVSEFHRSPNHPNTIRDIPIRSPGLS